MRDPIAVAALALSAVSLLKQQQPAAPGPVGATGKTGDTGPVGVVQGQSNIALVDANNGDNVTAAVGNGIPFRTLQAAIDAVQALHALQYGPLPPSPPTTTPPDPPRNARNGYVISVAPFTAYDEDLTVNVSGGLHLMITGEAGWDLGSFSGAVTNWQPDGAPWTRC